jgi:hypothetical protein
MNHGLVTMFPELDSLQLHNEEEPFSQFQSQRLLDDDKSSI